MKLSQKVVDGMRLPEGKKDMIVFDDDAAGLALRLQGESRTFIFQYRAGSKQRRVTIGRTSAITLAEARKSAGRLHAEVRLGGDPQGDKAAARAEAPAMTFGDALKPFLAAKRATLRPRTYAELERHLGVQARALHRLPLASVGRAEISALRTQLEADSGPSAANHGRASLSSFLGWAMREGWIDTNPVIATNKSPEKGARDRVLSESELRDIWAALGDGTDYADIVKLLLLTGMRRDEVGSLSWSEIDFDRGVISLPPNRTKNHRPFELPLSSPALAILRKRQRVDGRKFVFGEGVGAFSGWSACKRRLDERIAAARTVEKRPAKVGWVLHDLRRTMSTLMHERLGVAPHVVEACINHISGHQGGVAGVYNKAAYSAEKRRAFDLWGDCVETIVEGRPSKVVALRA